MHFINGYRFIFVVTDDKDTPYSFTFDEKPDGLEGVASGDKAVSYTHLDMEFTVENKKLYMLQCRNGKRTAPAALKIACDLVDEGHKVLRNGSRGLLIILNKRKII